MIIMIEYAQENEQKVAHLVPGIVCPNCFKSLMGFCMLRSWRDRYARRLRQYMGWCLDCQTGSEVVQFLADEKWTIHKHRYYAVVIQDGKTVPTGDWQTMNELPEPPAIVTGPGGDYCRGYDPKTIGLMKTVLNALKATTKTVETLLSMAAETKDDQVS